MLFKIAKAWDMTSWRADRGGLAGNGIVPHCRVIRGFPSFHKGFPMAVAKPVLQAAHLQHKTEDTGGMFVEGGWGCSCSLSLH